MAIDITTMILVSPSLVTCCTCHQRVVHTEAQSIKVVVPSGIYRNGRPVMRVTGQVVYECDSCFEKYPDDAA